MSDEIRYLQSNPFLCSSVIPCRIVWPDSGRARKVIRRSNKKHTEKFPSLKCGRLIELESQLEYDRATLLEMDPDVLSFYEQPFLLEYYFEGRWHEIYPDFLVEKKERIWVVEEVKPFVIAELPEVKEKFALEEMIVALWGYRFRVQTDQEIRSSSQLDHAKFLLPYRREKLSSQTVRVVQDALKEPCSGVELLEKYEVLSEDIIMAMLAQGVIVADFTESLSMNLKFKRP